MDHEEQPTEIPNGVLAPFQLDGRNESGGGSCIPKCCVWRFSGDPEGATG